jgi:hypothetical protein
MIEEGICTLFEKRVWENQPFLKTWLLMIFLNEGELL